MDLLWGIFVKAQVVVLQPEFSLCFHWPTADRWYNSKIKTWCFWGMFKNKQSHWLTLTGTQIHELCPCRGRQAECLYVCARPKTGLWVLLVWSVWCSQCAHRLRHQIDLFDPCSAVWFRTLKSLTVSSLMFSPFFHVEISCHLARNESDHGVPRFWLVSLKSPCGSPVPMQVKMLLERPKVSQVICVLQPYLDSEMLLSVTESNLIFKKKKINANPLNKQPPGYRIY